VFEQEVYKGEIFENNYIGAVVVQVSATDRDLNENAAVTYSLTGNASHLFQIDPSTGIITAAISFDRERGEYMSIQVLAKDARRRARTGTALVIVTVLDLNDERPRFTQSIYLLAVKESQPPGTDVGTVAAHDADSDVYGAVTYSLHHVGFGTERFRINQTTGQITTTAPLDREKTSIYHLNAVASDIHVPSLSTAVNVTIYVVDVNDNAPIFDFPVPGNETVYLPTEAPLGYVAIRLRAHDLDLNSNGRIIFEISENSKQLDFFDFDGDLGTLTVSRNVSGLHGRVFLLLFTATDMGLPRLRSTAFLRILVNQTAPLMLSKEDDVND